MKLRLVCWSVVLVVGWPVAVSAAPPVGVTLAAQPDAAAARAWLLGRFSPGTYVGGELDFLAGAGEVIEDPEASGVRLFVYSSGDQSAGQTAWVAWVGLDDDWFVVLVDSTPVK